jgi:CRISPR/Cas system-associated exonuclease Cas4 (RecB family)
VTPELLAWSAAAALVVTIAVGWLLRRRARADPWLRGKLAGARLVYAERLFRSRQSPLVARIDRGYRKDDRIWLMELKTRPGQRVYPSDVIELSAQKVALESETGMRVSEFGFVLTQSPDGSRRLHGVKLMRRTDIDELVRRRAAILSGSLEPRHARDPRLCRDCAYRAECGCGRARDPRG